MAAALLVAGRHATQPISRCRAIAVLGKNARRRAVTTVAAADLQPPPEPSDPPKQHAQVELRGVGKVRIAYTDSPPSHGNEAEPVVNVLAVHGVPGSVRDWRYLSPALERVGARVLRIDLPAQGDSGGSGSDDGPRVGASTTETGEALTDIVRQLVVPQLQHGGPPLVLLGHSLAGPACLHVAAHYPELAEGLALVNSVGNRPHTGVQPYWLVRGASRLIEAGIPVVSPALLRVAALTWRYVLGFPKGTPLADVRHGQRRIGGIEFHKHGATAAAVPHPTLVAWSADDPLIEDEVSVELAESLTGGGPRLRFERAGHNAQKTAADAIAHSIVNDLAPLLARRGEGPTSPLR